MKWLKRLAIGVVLLILFVQQRSQERRDRERALARRRRWGPARCLNPSTWIALVELRTCWSSPALLRLPFTHC